MTYKIFTVLFTRPLKSKNSLRFTVYRFSPPRACQINYSPKGNWEKSKNRSLLFSELAIKAVITQDDLKIAGFKHFFERLQVPIMNL